jgi:4-carboxymuconolactone decarboxylase
MATIDEAAQNILSSLAESDAPVLETVALMHLDTLERSGFDARTYHLVRLAALVAIDGPPMSFLVNGRAAVDAGVTMEEVQGVLTAVAPIVGSARVTAAAGHILRALGMAAAASNGGDEEMEDR